MSGTFKNVRDKFTGGYLGIPLEVQIVNCDKSELVPVFEQYLPSHQPVLEAGSGSGCWVTWFCRKGWRGAGLDWSPRLCAYIKKEIPDTRLVSGDMRAIPFHDGCFGAVVALGSIEHVPEGPENILKEFYRVLNGNGIAVITVPYDGQVRRMARMAAAPVDRVKRNPLIRKIFGKPTIPGKPPRELARNLRGCWLADFHHGQEGWYFYQFYFSKQQMRSLLDRAGFAIREETVIMPESGIINTFGRVAGEFDPLAAEIHLTVWGKLLRKILLCDHVGHMLCYVVEKK